MIVTFPLRHKIRSLIHHQRRHDLEKELRIRQMARIFERQERQQREALDALRRQDWK